MYENKAKWQQASEPEKRRDHPNYHFNLSSAKEFIYNTRKQLLAGMSVCLSDEDRVLMVGFSAPPDFPMGRYAAPINLHQDSKDVDFEKQFYLNGYMKIAKWVQQQISKTVEKAPNPAQDRRSYVEATFDTF